MGRAALRTIPQRRNIHEYQLARPYQNKAFWLALIPAVLLLVQVVAAVFGYTLDLGDLGNKLLAVVNAVFAVLSILGIVTDPTTAGIGDSPQAMTYEEPKQNPYN